MNTVRRKRMLKQFVDRWGYKYVSLTDENKNHKFLKVHRLVAIQYIPNPLNKPQVNHKDLDKLNPSASNLEWVTNQENIQHAYNHGVEMGFMKQQMRIKQINKITGEILNIFQSMREAERILKIPCQNISEVCTGKRKSAGGFIFETFND